MSSQPPDQPDDPGEKETYEVGYGKPPRATRFQAGRSGNPKGRPKGSRRKRPGDVAIEQLKALVLEEAYRPMQIRDGETWVEMSTVQAVLRAVSLKAMKGDQRAQRLILDTVGGIETELRRERIKSFETAVVYKLQGAHRIAEARSRGLPEPTLVPHPDHLIIDPFAGLVEVRGPYTPEEKKEWDELMAMRAHVGGQLAELGAKRRAAPRGTNRTPQIEALRSVVAKIDAELSHFHRVLVKGAA